MWQWEMLLVMMSRGMKTLGVCATSLRQSIIFSLFRNKLYRLGNVNRRKGKTMPFGELPSWYQFFIWGKEVKRDLLSFLKRTPHPHNLHCIQPGRQCLTSWGHQPHSYRFLVMTLNKHLLSEWMSSNILSVSLYVSEVLEVCSSLYIIFIKYFESHDRGSLQTEYNYLSLKDMVKMNYLIL